jgi:hypothetical protein
MRRTLLANQKASSVVGRLTGIMATGRAVSSALDNPQSFFAARALNFRSADLQRVLDGVDKSISVVKTALVGVEALERLLNQADAIVSESQKMLAAGQTDPEIFEYETDASLSPLSAQILSGDPVGYWRLNETAGGTAANLGSGGAAINGTYQSGVSLGNPGLYENSADTSAYFDGVNDRVAIPNSALINTANHPLRTVELVFNASTTAGRQVLYEEGGNTNSINIYIDNGLIYFNSRDAGNYGPFNISAPVVAGQTYHAAIVLDTNANYFRGYLDGEIVGEGVAPNPLASHTDSIGIGSLNGSSYMHDGASPSNTYRFNGFISDVALYNRALPPSELQSHAQSLNNLTEIEYRQRQYEDVLAQIDQLVVDAGYRGQNLLIGDTVTTFFNEHRTSSLVTEGTALSSDGMRLLRHHFNVAEDVEDIRDSIRAALERVRDFGAGLVNDLTILEGRRDMNYAMRNTLDEGADMLTLADMNNVGASFLAAQTRVALGVTALGLAAISGQSILSIFA